MLLAVLSSALLQLATASTIQANICTPLSQPSITQPADNTTTKSSQVHVKGDADPNVSVYILDNGQTLAQLTSDSSGQFASSITLIPGINWISAQANNNCGSIDSPVIGVTYNPPQPPPKSPSNAANVSTSSLNTVSTDTFTTAPLLAAATTTAPAAQPSPNRLSLKIISKIPYATTAPSIMLIGQTNMPASIGVSVNSRKVASVTTSDSGAFEVLVPLNAGSNTLVITATAGAQSAKFKAQVSRPLPAVSATSSPLTVIAAASGATLLSAAATGIVLRHWRLTA